MISKYTALSAMFTLFTAAPLCLAGCDADEPAASDLALADDDDAAAQSSELDKAAGEPESLDNSNCICLQVYDPVCGVNGVTYGNGCIADCAGVKVAHEGACTGHACDDNEQCSKEDFCQTDGPYNDGVCGAGGTCQPLPGGCPRVYDPVCGCDGESYSNSCIAHAAGVSVSFAGECPVDGCTDNSQCKKGEFCEQDGTCGGVGTCTDRPDACLDVHNPVCGCDGNVWGNGCYAHSAGVSIAGLDTCGILSDD